MSQFVDVSIQDRVQIIRLNRPDKKNALDLSMYTGLSDALQQANTDAAIRASVILAAGDTFCAGNDIADFLKNPPRDDPSPVIRFIRTLPGVEKPLLAGINGLAIGIGVTMLFHCDMVFAARGAKFQFPFVNIGLCPEAASTFYLPALVGMQKAAELFLLGEMFDADVAHNLGLVNRVVDAAQLEPEVLAAARRIAAQPPNSVRVTKRLMRDAVQDLAAAASRREIAGFVPMLTGAEATEALNAFMAKRKPDFSRF